MSYEGYREHLCEEGHYFACDAYDAPPAICPRCGKSWLHFHSVDQTNGHIEDDPSTQPGPKEQIGLDDTEHKDRFGNRFFVSEPRYRPLSGWRRA